ncbi:helix-turn-helix transcriptional regulator [Paenibacillus agricola]|uniref:AraC family transcriptional regulator n=1 Tax=Paenibacillus agricola TaxID=2716264 RepID=A0ABX0J265_9BACL|nr:AraC family transcriptional regulator [Paenibacillus agricola]NHN30227.1 AraC family transcriptional regulator [Paenibacillus agricola]
MYVWKASIEKPLEFISAGHFTAGYPWIHSKRSINSYEIIIGLRDIAYIEQEGERFEVHAGQALLLLPNRTHEGYAFSDPQVSFYWLHFQCPDEQAELLDEKGAESELIRYSQNPFLEGSIPYVLLPAFFEPLEFDKAGILFRQLLHIVESRYYTRQGADYMLTSLLIELSQQAVTAFAKSQSGTASKNQRLMSVLEWIRIHAADKISVDDIALEFNYNADYLTRLFKKEMGMNMQEYIQKVKMDHAKEELCRTDLPIKEIAHNCGFEDEKYFMKVFRKHQQMTPTEFRRAFYRTHMNNR